MNVKKLWQNEKSPDNYYATVATTWNLSLKQLEATKGAREFMNICSFLASEDIPLSLLIDNSELLDEPLKSVLSSNVERNKSLKVLRSYSLINRRTDKEDSYLSVHRLVQTVVRDGLSEKWLKFSVALLRKAFKFHMNEFETWEASIPLAAHAKQVIEHAGEMKEEVLAWLCFNLASYHRNYIILYKESELLFGKSIEISKETVGEEHADYATRLNDFAGLLGDMGRYEEAEPLYRQAIEVNKITIREKHPDYTIPLNNLADLLRTMERYEEGRATF